jgi:uncharacterized protein YndB with AHSA1/START domain
MLFSILIAVAILIVFFCFYVSSKPTRFAFERSGLISANAEKVFPFISRLDQCGKWSTYEVRDPAMNKSYSGVDGTPGAMMTFHGKKSGAGTIEIKKVVPHELVEFRLVMTKPFACDNVIKYSLKSEGEKSLFTWSMEGDNKFLNKLMMTIIDCDKMLDKDMNEGIANLKRLVE